MKSISCIVFIIFDSLRKLRHLQRRVKFFKQIFNILHLSANIFVIWLNWYLRIFIVTYNYIWTSIWKLLIFFCKIPNIKY